MLKINTKTQILAHYKNDQLLVEYPISTAKNGLGEAENSYCTPRGVHKIFQKIGVGEPPGTIFVARRPTGEVYSAELSLQYPSRDWVLSRILWLAGCEDFNQNSKERFIYIHGTPDSEPVGVPLSHGCIRMRNADIIALFAGVDEGDKIIIA